MECSEQASPERQKVDYCLLGDGDKGKNRKQLLMETGFFLNLFLKIFILLKYLKNIKKIFFKNIPY